ncbi:MAG: anaerobic ribonucleoside-triphosphate reductase activating protein [Muribaculaceae bacterium]|nr:anaerobic ribonucleoside-triphosphate reductase activating protein [Muribaculaceae bacterium]
MNQTIRVAGIVDGTSVDGPGLRTSIYTAGCAHACPGCHNEQTWPFDSGEDYTVQQLLERIDKNDFNVTLSGGDPMYQAKALLPLAKAIKERGLTIWCYTGFLYEQLLEMPDAAELLKYIDVLVDGPYVDAQRDPDLRFRGSSNQRLIDVAASLATETTLLHT